MTIYTESFEPSSLRMPTNVCINHECVIVFQGTRFQSGRATQLINLVGSKTDSDKRPTGCKPVDQCGLGLSLDLTCQEWHSIRASSLGALAQHRRAHTCPHANNRKHYSYWVCLTMALMVSSQSGRSLGWMWASSGTMSSSSRWRPGLRPLKPTNTNKFRNVQP